MMNTNNGLIFILLFSFLQMGMLAISTVLGNIAEAFPLFSASSIQMVATLPDIFIVLMTLVVGKLSDRISIKKWLIISCGLFIVVACGGFFFHSHMYVLYFWSILLGCAIGILMTSIANWIAQSYRQEQRDVIIGYQNIAVSVGGILVSIASGILAIKGYKFIYLIYLWAIICLIGFVKQIQEKSNDEGKKKAKIDSEVLKETVIISMIVFVFFSLYNGVTVNISQYLFEKNFDSARYAAICISAQLVGSSLMAFAYTKICHIHSLKLLSVSIVILSVGTLTAIVATNVIWSIICLVFAGSSLTLAMSSATSYLMNYKGKDNGYPVSIMLACSDAGGFFSAFYISLSALLLKNASANDCFLIIGCIAFILAIFAYLHYLKEK